MSVTELSHPGFDETFSDLTRVVKGPDENLYVGGTFYLGEGAGAALFLLNDPTTAVQTWPGLIVGFDNSLRGIGNIDVLRTSESSVLVSEFLLDGSIMELEVPPDEFFYAEALDVSQSGYAVGGAQFEGILRTDGAIWTPYGEFSFIEPRARGPHATAGSVRDRTDGQGINIGFMYTGRVKYGDEPFVELYEPDADRPIDASTIVSQSNFAIVNKYADLDGFEQSFAYYPGIVPGAPGVVRPIDVIFPELATLNFEAVSDLYAVDGRIYMALYGEDGLYLFGARDPSVIPEPSTLALAVVVIIGFVWRRRSTV